jgi:hypothetical protein
VWTGREMAGSPAMLTNAVNETIRVSVARGPSGSEFASSYTGPTGGATTAVVGVRRTSKSRPHWATTSRDSACRRAAVRA